MAQFVDKVTQPSRYAITILIVVEDAQTPAGGRDMGDPARRKPEEAPGPPAESEASGTKINS
ncbi:multidrug transporter [Sutcliffiella horikoshii]|nr:multidrug transporter [Sutcliffiella horikoshii]